MARGNNDRWLGGTLITTGLATRAFGSLLGLVIFLHVSLSRSVVNIVLGACLLAIASSLLSWPGALIHTLCIFS